MWFIYIIKGGINETNENGKNGISFDFAWMSGGCMMRYAARGEATLPNSVKREDVLNKLRDMIELRGGKIVHYNPETGLIITEVKRWDPTKVQEAQEYIERMPFQVSIDSDKKIKIMMAYNVEGLWPLDSPKSNLKPEQGKYIAFFKELAQRLGVKESDISLKFYWHSGQPEGKVLMDQPKM